MARFRLDLEYVGTRYSGWQDQKNARTVQGALHEAVRRVAKRTDFESYGSGRTDAGVHALHQVAHLDLESRLPPETLRRALNDELPADIHLLRLAKVTRQFHARHSAVGRSYLYQIARRRTAFGKPFVWWIRDPLDAKAIAATGRVFEGMHDFRSYCDADPAERSTRVKLDRVAGRGGGRAGAGARPRVALPLEDGAAPGGGDGRGRPRRPDASPTPSASCARPPRCRRR